MISKKLELGFLDEASRTFKLALDDPREDLNSQEIKGVMDSIINYNIFENREKSLAGIQGARIISTEVVEIHLED